MSLIIYFIEVKNYQSYKYFETSATTFFALNIGEVECDVRNFSPERHDRGPKGYKRVQRTRVPVCSFLHREKIFVPSPSVIKSKLLLATTPVPHPPGFHPIIIETKMNFPSFEQSINQVNHAVSLIQAGKYSDAINGLTASLSTFKERMAQETVDGCDEELQEGSSLRTSLDQCMKSSCSSGASCESMILDDGYIQEERFFLYKQAITIPHFKSQSCQDGVLVSCMIIFNLAIAYHLQGLSDQEDGQSSLVRALKLYELSFNLQREHEFENNILFTLAVINNLGLCHCQLHDEESSHKCFEHLLSTLMYLTDCGEASRSHFDGFFVNVTRVMSEPRVAPAA
jgi:hypothetical protein